MSKSSLQVMSVIVSLFVMLSFGVSAEDYPLDSDVSSEAPRITTYTHEQLDQMLAPIALYPDSLVAQILMAATYPLEVVAAARWLQNPDNAALHGDQLEAVLLDLPWDPSIKALIVFPEIVRMMDGNLQWAEQLGDAFVGQQAEVMDEIQRLRQRALAAGTLQSTPSQTVTTQDSIVTIDPTNVDVIYVPVYYPTAVYGTWPYPDYPPYSFTPAYHSRRSLIEFGIGTPIIKNIFFFHHSDFRHRRINIDDRRFRFLNRGRPSIKPGIWAHDPAHRRNVPHHAPELRGRGRGQFAVPAAQRPFRGFGVNETVRPSRRDRPSPAVVSPVPQRRAPASASVTIPLPQVRHERTPGRSRTFGNVARPSVSPSAMRRPSAPVFESHSRGFEVRSHSARGQSSRFEMNIHREKSSFGRGERQRDGGGNRSFGGNRGSGENRGGGGNRGGRGGGGSRPFGGSRGHR